MTCTNDLPRQPTFTRSMACGLLILLSATASRGMAANLAALEAGRPPSFAAIAKKTMPVVVNIATASQRSPRSASSDPIEDFFNRFFGESTPRENSLGSLGAGILISKDGGTLTNYHGVP